MQMEYVNKSPNKFSIIIIIVKIIFCFSFLFIYLIIILNVILISFQADEFFCQAFVFLFVLVVIHVEIIHYFLELRNRINLKLKLNLPFCKFFFLKNLNIKINLSRYILLNQGIYKSSALISFSK